MALRLLPQRPPPELKPLLLRKPRSKFATVAEIKLRQMPKQSRNNLNAKKKALLPESSLQKRFSFTKN